MSGTRNESFRVTNDAGIGGFPQRPDAPRPQTRWSPLRSLLKPCHTQETQATPAQAPESQATQRDPHESVYVTSFKAFLKKCSPCANREQLEHFRDGTERSTPPLPMHTMPENSEYVQSSTSAPSAPSAHLSEFRWDIRRVQSPENISLSQYPVEVGQRRNTQSLASTLPGERFPRGFSAYTQ